MMYSVGANNKTSVEPSGWIDVGSGRDVVNTGCI